MLDKRLEDDIFDIENIIDELDKLAGASQVASHWQQGIVDGAMPDVTVVRNEAEWFVQHICERISPMRARCMWRNALESLASHDATVATTNYDRAVELAAIESSTPFSDGFDTFDSSEYVRWTDFAKSGCIRLLKLHGSTDWYRPVGEDTVLKLRHSMALFGQVTINLESMKLGHAVVLPSREKAVTQFPFDKLHFRFRKEAEESEAAIFLGTSLRDPHIRSVCTECASRIETFVVSPRIRDDDPTLPRDAKAIRQTASRFLISALPLALRCTAIEDFAESLTAQPAGGEPLLDWLSVASDDTIASAKRCEALDWIASSSVPLPRSIVERFLNDRCDDVRTYGLGLLQDSPDRDELVGFARVLAAASPESKFASEEKLLHQLLENSPVGE